MKPLTQKEILKKHENNPQDKSLQNNVETKEINKDTFNKLTQQSTKLKLFDKKK